METIRSLTSLLVGVVPLTSGGGDSNRGPVASTPPDSVRQDIEQSIASVNDLRESLAATIDTPTVDKATFKRVCKPVGQRAKTMSVKRGRVVLQLAEKYRNPAYELDEEARRLYDRLSSAPHLPGTRYGIPDGDSSQASITSVRGNILQQSLRSSPILLRAEQNSIRIAHFNYGTR